MSSFHDPAHTTPQGWRLRLEALIAERMRMPFAWGSNDCCLFAADAVLAVAGQDPASEWRGTYSDAAGAARLVRELGGLPAIAARGGEPIAPLMAQPGDVGLVMLDDRELLAVCVGEYWVAPSSVGLVSRTLDAASHAWRVPRG